MWKPSIIKTLRHRIKNSQNEVKAIASVRNGELEEWINVTRDSGTTFNHEETLAAALATYFKRNEVLGWKLSAVCVEAMGVL